MSNYGGDWQALRAARAIVEWADPYQKQVHLETLLAIAEENQNVANSQALKGYKHGTR